MTPSKVEKCIPEKSKTDILMKMIVITFRANEDPHKTTFGHHAVTSWFGILVSILFLALSGIPADADDPAPADSPPVFRPNETQHGFAQYDTPPDFSSAVPLPYQDYSQSPQTISPSAQKPAGLFLELEFAESIEEEPTIRRGHAYVPVNPTTTFTVDNPSVYLVFSVHKHLTSYQIIGRLFHETGTGLELTQWIDEDIVELATEDESGYLKFFPPEGSWKPGRYRVDIYVGYVANPMNKMGAMQFTVSPPR
jgi:hypothetical protein